MLLFTCILVICLARLNTALWIHRKNVAETLDVFNEWKYIDYDFGSDAKRQDAIKSGLYNPKACAPIDVDRWGDKMFMTVIRDHGVPSSLNVVTNKAGPGGPLLQPYPDWSWTKLGDCSGITSVYRVAIDNCNKLWVLDTGVVGNDRVCPAQLLAFDLPTSKLVKRVKIPDDIARNATSGQGLLVTPIVQTFRQNCKRTNVYIADVEGYALIVYNGNTFRRLTSSSFDYDPKAMTYTIQGQSFQLQDGIVGMALSERTQKLYFSPMSSYNLGYMDTAQIRELQSSNPQYKVYNDLLWTQASAKAISRTGALFFGLVNDTSIGCWNEQKPLSRDNIDIVAMNPQTLQFTSGMKVKRHRRNEIVWALTNRFQKIATGTMNLDEVNFRILRGSVFDLIYGSRCWPPQKGYFPAWCLLLWVLLVAAINTVLAGIIAFGINKNEHLRAISNSNGSFLDFTVTRSLSYLKLLTKKFHCAREKLSAKGK